MGYLQALEAMGAGNAALYAGMFFIPGGEFGEAAEAAVAAEGAEDAITLYRGVDALHPGYANALEGIANPIGGDATALQHVLGNTASEFTSWTSDFGVAEGFAT